MLLQEKAGLSAVGDDAAPRAPIELPHHEVGASPASYKPSAPVLPSTRHLIVEGQGAHAYLCTLYGQLEASQLLIFPNAIWHTFDEALEYVQRSITPLLQTLTFVSLDPLLYGASRRAFARLLRQLNIPCFGILHRPPDTAERADALREAAPQMAGILVLAEPLVELMQEQFQLTNVLYLPIHPPFAAYATRSREKVRSKVGASEAQAVFSVLGQVHRGKGIDLLLQALDHVPPADLNDMLFLIAGRSFLDCEKISKSFSDRNAHCYLDLRSSDDPVRYTVLTDREFGEFVAASDFGLLLYQEDQRLCMSGVAPNYVWGSKPLIALRNSIIGRTVAQNELGIVIDDDVPQAVAKALTSALRLVRQGWQPTAAYNKYRAEIAPDRVLDKLAEILGDKPQRRTTRLADR